MKRADPAGLRKALQAANMLAQAGVMFVCMPVLNEADGLQLVAQAAQRFEDIIEETEQQMKNDRENENRQRDAPDGTGSTPQRLQ